jgi:predicted metalloendopeptidase
MISSSTRAHAMEKMKQFTIKIGYPNVWQSVEKLSIFSIRSNNSNNNNINNNVVDEDANNRAAYDYYLELISQQSTNNTILSTWLNQDPPLVAYNPTVSYIHLTNVCSSVSFEFQRELHRINAPTDRSRWYMTPQTVNAYYHPSHNEIVFPAAILQPPFFDASADLAVQYGSLGSVVGHEMTHGFDDQGRKYDSEGNLRDWWSNEDATEYERRAQKMIEQATRVEIYGNQLNGQLTCGENIADLGGVKLALRALQQVLQREYIDRGLEIPLINGFTPIQRLFLSWSQAWRENGKSIICFLYTYYIFYIYI